MLNVNLTEFSRLEPKTDRTATSTLFSPSSSGPTSPTHTPALNSRRYKVSGYGGESGKPENSFGYSARITHTKPTCACSGTMRHKPTVLTRPKITYSLTWTSFQFMFKQSLFWGLGLRIYDRIPFLTSPGCTVTLYALLRLSWLDTKPLN